MTPDSVPLAGNRRRVGKTAVSGPSARTLFFSFSSFLGFAPDDIRTCAHPLLEDREGPPPSCTITINYTRRAPAKTFF